MSNKRMSSENRRTRIGIIFIASGAVLLVICLLWIFLGKEVGNTGQGFMDRYRRVINQPIRSWFTGKGNDQEEYMDPLQRPHIEAPVPTGNTELSDFYQQTPRDEKIRMDIPENTEENIDSSLWMSEYHTNVEGISWRKDEQTQDILSDTKKGENQFPTHDLVSENSHLDGNGASAYPPDSAVPTRSGENASQVPSSSKPLRVEFWQSPVNYKGYKLEGNHLVLFGIDPNDTLRFENHPDGIWMYHKGNIFLLENNHDFVDFKLHPAQQPGQSKTIVGGKAPVDLKHIEK